ncbi:HAUS augmin like complex subunit 2 [Willisornis vidua]|uniref:HAUS augmin like complex subunit 2 n=1 Tax=Willisornis vidua TaxID=1566151 RepID=A0ABQ9D1N1_9PASS|nr:HAUS augmin like complex subunit 2 [Willisornis vidua]
MATPELSLLEASCRDSGKPASAERCCRIPASPSLHPRGAAEPQSELSSGLDAERSGGESRPEGPGQHSAVSALLQRCVAEGAVSQETLDLTCRETPCFVKFSEMEKAANMQAEMNEIKLKIEIMQLENETADITHHFYLAQFLSRGLILGYRCIVQLLTEAVTFIEKLESHLHSVRSIPQIPNMMKNMDTALTKTEVLVMDLEELTEQILKWRELQKEVYSDSIWKSAELDFGLSLT